VLDPFSWKEFPQKKTAARRASTPHTIRRMTAETGAFLACDESVGAGSRPIFTAPIPGFRKLQKFKGTVLSWKCCLYLYILL